MVLKFFKNELSESLNVATYDAHTDPIFKELKILKFAQIHFLQLGLFMFSYNRSILSRKFENMFTLNHQVHSYNTRSLNKFRLPLCKLNIRKFSIQFQGPKYYNSLSPELLNCFSIHSFKAKFKFYLINN